MNLILIIFLAIVLSAFFSGMEIAFVASNRLRIELDRKQEAFGSGIIKFFTDNPGQYIATMLMEDRVHGVQTVSKAVAVRKVEGSIPCSSAIQYAAVDNANWHSWQVESLYL